MKYVGKYEKNPEAKTDKSLLTTYVTSLLSLVLCVTMFLSTTFAWFTSDVTSGGNQIYVGSLNVQLMHHANNTWNDVTKESYKILRAENYWAPDVFEVVRLKIVNSGSIGFTYKLQMDLGDGAFAQDALNSAEESALKSIFVYGYDSVVDDNFTIPATISEVTVVDSGWTKIGSLYDVMLNKYSILSGEMAPVSSDSENLEQQRVFILHMDPDSEEVNNAVGAKFDNIIIRLIADQKQPEAETPSEPDPEISDTTP